MIATDRSDQAAGPREAGLAWKPAPQIDRPLC